MNNSREKFYVSHSPTTRDKISGLGMASFGRWRKSIKDTKSIGGKILCNCYGDSKEDAEIKADFICKAVNEYDKLKAINESLLSALKEISEGKGAFNIEPLIHAANCIKEMKSLAIKAIELAEK